LKNNQKEIKTHVGRASGQPTNLTPQRARRSWSFAWHETSSEMSVQNSPPPSSSPAIVATNPSSGSGRFALPTNFRRATPSDQITDAMTFWFKTHNRIASGKTSTSAGGHSRGQMIEPGEHQAVNVSKRHSLGRFSSQYIELVSKQEDFGFQRSTRPK
jgi:hypothetical protein